MKELGIFDGEFAPAEINPHNEGVLDVNYDGTLKESDIIGVPQDKEWPQTDYVRPWDSLNGEEKALFIRMAEIYAAFSTYTDEQIGRLLTFLEETGQMDNTIIIAVADNGASAEGGPNGSVNENLFFNGIEDDFDTNFAFLQELGTEKTYNHYPSGWAWAFDTPFKYWKRWSGYEGGAATPFMMCGPGINTTDEDSYEYRKQYIHAVDVVPTLYEMVGIKPPEVVKGYPQNPIEGISFKYTFDPNYGQPEYQFPYNLVDADKPKDENGKTKKVRETQFYSMLGTRGVWYKGWHACTVHAPTPSNWSNFEKDIWELYCMDGDSNLRLSADPTQSNNLAQTYLDKLELMKNMWFVQAGIYKGLPLDDRSTTEIISTPRPQLADPPFSDEDNSSATFSYTYYPGGSEIPEAVAPNIRTRSYAITATVGFSAGEEAPEGVLLAHGGRFGGHSFYIHENRLCYVYNWLGQREQKVSCPLPNNLSGEVELKVEFNKSLKQGEDANLDAAKFGSSTLGEVQLSITINGNPASGLETTWQLGDGGNWTDWTQEWASPNQFLTQPSKFALSGEGFNIVTHRHYKRIAFSRNRNFQFFQFIIFEVKLGELS